jgi:hypothetical protein
MLTFSHRRSRREVFRELAAILEDEGYVDEYFSPQYGMPGSKSDADAPMPRLWRIACWACTGGSEGWYVHIDLIYQEGKNTVHEPFALGKTWRKWDGAWAMAKRCAELLDV